MEKGGNDAAANITV